MIAMGNGFNAKPLFQKRQMLVELAEYFACNPVVLKGQHATAGRRPGQGTGRGAQALTMASPTVNAFTVLSGGSVR